jgi:hypothetical protein
MVPKSTMMSRGDLHLTTPAETHPPQGGQRF